MKRLIKYLVLPVAFTCCSMAVNSPSIQLTGLTIVDENTETIRLRAYMKIFISDAHKRCSYRYYWKDFDNVSHECGGDSRSELSKTDVYAMTKSTTIKKSELNKRPTITFLCQAQIANEGTYSISMKYNAVGRSDEVTIIEKENGSKISSGYIRESIHPTDMSKNYHYEDIVTFLNYEDLVVNEFYYNFDISRFRFIYTNGQDDALKGNFRFAFYDRYTLFPDFPIDDNMYRSIPLTVNHDQDGYYFTFTPTMYYDADTHDCSLLKKEGYLETNTLMLPFKGEDDLKFLPCYLEMNIDGFIPFKLSGTFMLTYLKKHHGDEEESEFYTNIYQDDDVNINEKVVDVII